MCKHVYSSVWCIDYFQTSDGPESQNVLCHFYFSRRLTLSDIASFNQPCHRIALLCGERTNNIWYISWWVTESAQSCVHTKRSTYTIFNSNRKSVKEKIERQEGARKGGEVRARVRLNQEYNQNKHAALFTLLFSSVLECFNFYWNTVASERVASAVQWWLLSSHADDYFVIVIRCYEITGIARTIPVSFSLPNSLPPSSPPILGPSSTRRVLIKIQLFFYANDEEKQQTLITLTNLNRNEWMRCACESGEFEINRIWTTYYDWYMLLSCCATIDVIRCERCLSDFIHLESASRECSANKITQTTLITITKQWYWCRRRRRHVANENKKKNEIENNNNNRELVAEVILNVNNSVCAWPCIFQFQTVFSLSLSLVL